MYGPVNARYHLKPGDRLKVIHKKEKQKVTVVKEYPYHILVDVGAYRESVNKIDIYTGEIKLVRIQKG